jgi:hypothetical protein
VRLAAELLAGGLRLLFLLLGFDMDGDILCAVAGFTFVDVDPVALAIQGDNAGETGFTVRVFWRKQLAQPGRSS